ncbi:MAG TPA: hypothetical protein PKA82_11950 [Pyrinomonadaceae bacterium]|nr:hypothetical protein [Pyrinomonadaceae bacterium]
MPFWQGMLLMIVLMIIIFAGLGVGAYFFIKFLAKVVNQRRDEWDETAKQLGLTVDQASGVINKDMSGTINGHCVRVTKFSVAKGEYSADHYAAVTIDFDAGLPFSFSIKKHETIWGKIGDLISATEEKFAGLESDFDLEISDTNETMRLLNVEIPNGNAPTLLGEISMLRREHHRVILTDTSVTLSGKIELGDSSAVSPTIDRCFYVVETIKAAAKAIATA